MRKLLICIALTAVCGVLSTPSSQATLTQACAFVCCNRPHLQSTPCNISLMGSTGATTCGVYLQMYGCP